MHNCLVVVRVALTVPQFLHVLQTLIALLNESARVADVEIVRCTLDNLFFREAFRVLLIFVALCQPDQTVSVHSAILSQHLLLELVSLELGADLVWDLVLQLVG